MTVRLREALHEAADEVPGYLVYERALATARRTRRRTAAATAAVLVALAAMVWSVPVGQPGGQPGGMEPGSGSGALPDQIWKPPIGALRVTDPFPMGSAALLFTGMRTMGSDEDGTVGAVGAEADRYRVLHVGYIKSAGHVVLLSPDGTRLAYPPEGDGTAPRVDIVDLTDGSVQQIPAVAAGSVSTQPLGWSPDGRGLVVIDSVRVDAERSSYRNVLSLVEPDTGTTVHLASAPDTSSIVPGYAVAFAPDGQKLALQVDDTLTITDVAGTPRQTFRLPPDEILAGKGAWSPDSRAVTVAKRRGDAWTLATIDPATGAPLGDLDVPAVSGVAAIRLLGWGPGGAALVVAYQPTPEAARTTTKIEERILYPNVRTVRLLSLAPGAAAPITRMTAPIGVSAVDVADGLVRWGGTRVAEPPFVRLGPRFWFWLVVAVALGAAVLGGRWYVRRREVSRR
ncbi:hypothetical protein [Micromonospora sp. NPDC049679]|uniref:WD40 repeat domain-containing protein n=1 Tax=Micromonospora sp. NPDC049679 TaxID=3155920 RepID=UPI0033E59CDB